MTPLQIVSAVIAELERPDLRSMANDRFRTALHSAHGIEKFRRDLADDTFWLGNYTVLDGKVSIPIPVRFREMTRIRTQKPAGTDLQTNFMDLKNKLELRDYWGRLQEQTYNIFGPSINLGGISTTATHVVFEYLRWPTYFLNGAEYTTNSWIAAEFPELIKAYLRHELAMIVGDEDQKNAAATQVNLMRQTLIAQYVEDIL